MEAAPAELAPVRPDAWLDRQAAHHVDTLLEHSISLPNYNAVLTLLWAYKMGSLEKIVGGFGLGKFAK